MLTNTLSGEGPTALLVVGEAGVGKTRLIAVAADATRTGVAVLAGSCLPLSERRPFLPIVDVYRRAAHSGWLVLHGRARYRGLESVEAGRRR
jgi:predicted ATPase